MNPFEIVFEGIPVILVVLGIVEFAKKLGNKDVGSLILSMLLGIVFGGGYYIAQNGLPVSFAGWFQLVLIGLVLGLSSCGLYDYSKKFMSGTNSLPPVQ